MNLFKESIDNSTDKFYVEDIIVGVSKLGQMAAKIAYYNYEWRYDTLVVFNIIRLIALEVFLSNYRKAVVVKKGKYIASIRERRPHVPQFVIFGQDTTELSDMIQWLIETKYDNTAKYVVVCSTIEHLECDEKAFFQAISQIYIANIVFLKLSNNEEPMAYSYHQILPGNCWNSEPEKLDLVFDCVNDTCLMSLFPEKFNNFHLCPLIISTVEQPPFMYLKNGTAGVEPSGGDGDIIKLVASILNATLIIKTPPEAADWGHFQDSNWTGSLGDVFNHRAHGSMCSTPLTPYKYGNFQISFTYDSMDMVWAAGLPALKPSWEKLLYPLPIYMRITLLCMFIGIAFLNTFLKTKVWKNVRSVLKIAAPKENLLFYSWILFLGMPVMKMPSKQSFRMMIFTWIFFCTIIRSVYQGTLVGSLKLRVYQSNLETFDDVLNNKYPFGGLPSLKEYFSEDPAVYDHWEYVFLQDAYDALDKMSNGSTNFVIALNKETIVDYLLNYGGTRQLQIIPDKIVNSPTVIFFKKYSNLATPISHCLTIALEGGFSQRLYGRYVNHARTLFQQSKSNGPEPLQLQHFTGCAAILILGWILSIIFFFVEVVCG